MNSEIEEKNPNPKSRSEAKSEQGYLLITADQFLFVDSTLNLVLYPGVSGVCTQEQYDRIHDGVKPLIKAEKISQAEFIRLFAKSGIMGVIRD